MKKNQIELGKVYLIKVSGVVSPVRIDCECDHGGWVGF